VGTAGLSLLGGLLGLDGTSVGQFMVSRPLVAGAVAGWATGAPELGIGIGAILEIYLLVSFPTGGSRFPEGATATVVAVGSCAGVPGHGAVAIGLAVGLVWGQVGGASITLLRRWNGKMVPVGSGAGVPPRRVETAQLFAVACDFLRGVLVTAAGLMVGAPIVRGIGPAWPLDDPGTRGLALLGAAVSLGILMRDFGGVRRHGILLGVGLVTGLAWAALQ